MMKPLRVGIWILNFLVFASPALAKDSYEKSFDLKVGGISIGQVIVSFEDRISPGHIDVNVSASPESPSGSVFPAGVYPFPIDIPGQGLPPGNGLPGTGLPGISLPVWITITTTVGFRGPAKVGLHLEVLEYDPSLPLRLFVSDGQPGSIFKDITSYEGPGSMYTSGYRDAFSEFVIAWDGRTAASAIKSKFNDLNKYLNANRDLIDRDRYQELRDLLKDASQAYNREDIQESIDDLEQFYNSVETAIANDEMPSTFNDPQNQYPNVAGALIMLAKTTQFSLGLLL